MQSHDIATFLGYAAGTMVTTAAIPKIIATILGTPAMQESVARNALMVCGNALWVVYGVCIQAWPVAICCGISTLLNGVVLILPWLKQRRPVFH